MAESNVATVVDDCRIDCSNDDYLDKILDVAIKEIDSMNLGEDRAAFIKCLTDEFLNIVQSNVTVNGLPWKMNEERLSSEQREAQKNESNDALLSKLSKLMERAASRRKWVPIECNKMLETKQQHERQNIKNKPIDYPVPPPQPPVINPIENSVKHADYAKMQEDFVKYKKAIDAKCVQIKKAEKDLLYVQELVKRNNQLLNDTGYGSDENN